MCYLLGFNVFALNMNREAKCIQQMQVEAWRFQHILPSLWIILGNIIFHFWRRGNSRHHSLYSIFVEILLQGRKCNMSDLFCLRIYMLLWILYLFLNILDIIFSLNNPSSCFSKVEIKIFQEVFLSYHQYLPQI